MTRRSPIGPLRWRAKAGLDTLCLWLGVGFAVVWAVGAVALRADQDPSPGQTPAAGQESVLVEVVDSKGRQVTDLTADDFVIRIGGEPRQTVALAPGSEEWRVIVLFDLVRAPVQAARNVAAGLSERARELTAQGAVEIVLFDDQLRQSMPPTRDPLTLAQNLSWLSLRLTGQDEQVALREEFLSEHDLDGQPEIPYPDPLQLSAAAGDAMKREARLLARHNEQLVAWLAETQTAEPTLLVWVSGGFDDEPALFYGSVMQSVGLLEAGETPAPVAVRTPIGEVSAVLGAYGWVTIPYVPPARSRSSLLDFSAGRTAEETEALKILGRDVPTDLSDPTEERTATGFDLLGGKRRDSKEAEADEPAIPLLVDPMASLRSVAADTGGRLVTEERDLLAALERLPWRRRLLFSSSPIAADTAEPGETRSLEVSSGRADLHLSAPRWLGTGTPSVVGEIRARRFLSGELVEPGELAVGAAVRATSGGLVGGDLIVQFEGDESVTGPLRVTVAMDWGGSDLSIYQRRLALSAGGPGVAGTTDKASRGLYYHLPAPAPSAPENRVVVVVEDLATGRWGGAFASYLDASTEAVDDQPYLLPAPRVVNLIAPQEILIVGSVLISTIISTAEVRRIDFFLDGKVAGSDTSPPFSVTLNVGRLPRAREVEAVAYDADGIELGRDVMVLNEGAGSLRVRIVRPLAEELRRRGKVTGSLEVEAEVKAPRFAPVERVEFYWNTELVATSYGPPYRQRVRIPEENPQGFVRVVAQLEDGTTGEDVLFVNAVGSTERLDVSLVELFVVVADRDGQPVRGLSQESFRVLEEGDEQAIASFSDAGGLPLTVGLAIDTSASMFIKLPQVQRAAADFVVGSLEARDRAFVVGFGDEPELIQDTTSKPDNLVRAIGGMTAGGHTAVWKAIVYSLVQLQGVPGRKALILYSDGADEDDEFSFRTCLQFARRLGVPIYMIIANNEIYRTGGKNLTVKTSYNRLVKLSKAVGGKVFVTHVGADLEAIYSEIASELRSQYLVAYYPDSRGDDVWRRVEVKVDEPGLEARTIAGYFR